MQSRFRLLGNIVDADGISTDPEKIRAIANAPEPYTKLSFEVSLDYRVTTDGSSETLPLRRLLFLHKHLEIRVSTGREK